MLTENILGVVLCGGESARMGSDKGLLRSKNKVWAEIAMDQFSECGLEYVVSVNSNQFTSYAKVIDEKKIIEDDTTLTIRGPLLGILSVHRKFQEKDLVVVACDMILMNSVVIKKLLDEFSGKNFEAVAFKNEKVEPLCALYSSQGLNKILRLHRNDRLQKFSMMHVLEILNTKYLLMNDDWKPYFKNLNSPGDIGNG